MKRILAYLGDYYHRREPIETALRKVLQPEIAEGRLQLIIAGTTDEFVHHLSDKPQAAILYAINKTAPERDPELMWMHDRNAEAIVRYVEEGGGYFAWHAGLASYPEDSSYVRLLRGYFVMHPPLKPVSYEGAGELASMKPFELLDEHYMIKVDERETEVFLRSYSEDGESIAGWRHAAGEGRVCCLTPAHSEAALREEALLKLLRHSLSWTAGL